MKREILKDYLDLLEKKEKLDFEINQVQNKINYLQTEAMVNEMLSNDESEKTFIFGEDKYKVSLESKVFGTLPKEDYIREICLQIIKECEGDYIIKRNIEVEISSEMDNSIKSLIQELRERKLNFKIKEDVNHNTLAAFIRQRNKQGKKLPEGLGVFIKPFCKVKKI